jgi:hypothetical protein
MEPDLPQGSAQKAGEILVFLIRKYDRMLLEGIERHKARALVGRDVENKLDQWRHAPENTKGESPNVER